MSQKIVITVEVTGIEHWGVDWNNKSLAANSLKEVCSNVSNLIEDYLGGRRELQVEAKVEND